MVFFAYDDAKPPAEAGTLIAQVAADILKHPGTRVVVVGHSDTFASSAYNDRLAWDRARAVAEALVSAGVPQAAITTESKGETEPLIATGDGVNEPQNRRVTITLSEAVAMLR